MLSSLCAIDIDHLNEKIISTKKKSKTKGQTVAVCQ